jgi:nucleoside-diphosphate-sugar epimerase
MHYVVGASGLIGTAIAERISKLSLFRVAREEYTLWDEKGRLEAFLLAENVNEHDTFYYCAGITDPSADKEDLFFLNYQLPLTLLEHSIEIGYHVVTFGTILETSRLQNPYIDSKKSFFQASSRLEEFQTHRHFQIHTVYGIHPPKAHTLLGKIDSALRNNSVLEMTSGLQLREYWHARDVANFITSKKTLDGWGRVTRVTSGHPIRLQDLALTIFRHFSAEKLLRIGHLSDEPSELYDYEIFKQTENAARFMRNPLNGVVRHFESDFNER